MRSAGELTIRPGFPASWDHASFHHPFLDYSLRTEGAVNICSTTEKSVDTGSDHASVITRQETVQTPGFAEVYSVTERFPKPQSLRLQIAARGRKLPSSRSTASRLHSGRWMTRSRCRASNQRPAGGAL